VTTTTYRSLRTGHSERWAVDIGEWRAERVEDSGTPWVLIHRPSEADGSWPTPVALLGTERACRRYVEQGWAALELARLKCEHGESRGGEI
jgi:hypothetical protein